MLPPFRRDGLLTFCCEWPHSHAVCSLFRTWVQNRNIKSSKSNRFLTPRFSIFVNLVSLSSRLLIFSNLRFLNTSRLFLQAPKKWANGLRVVTFLKRCENSPPPKVLKSVVFLTSDVERDVAMLEKCYFPLVFFDFW